MRRRIINGVAGVVLSFLVASLGSSAEAADIGVHIGDGQYAAFLGNLSNGSSAGFEVVSGLDTFLKTFGGPPLGGGIRTVLGCIYLNADVACDLLPKQGTIAVDPSLNFGYVNFCAHSAISNTDLCVKAVTLVGRGSRNFALNLDAFAHVFPTVIALDAVAAGSRSAFSAPAPLAGQITSSSGLGGRISSTTFGQIANGIVGEAILIVP